MFLSNLSMVVLKNLIVSFHASAVAYLLDSLYEFQLLDPLLFLALKTRLSLTNSNSNSILWSIEQKATVPTDAKVPSATLG